MISVVMPSLRVTPARLAAAERLVGYTSVLEVLIVRPRGASGAESTPGEGVRVLSAPLGRASQMNAGARAARGEMLLFLHADGHVGSLGLRRLAAALERRPRDAFAFSLGFDSARRRYRILAAFARGRDRVSPFPLGDQGLAMSAATFRALGGFEDVPLFEDVRMLYALRRRRAIHVLPARVATSAARFERLGVLRTLAINAWLILRHVAGAEPADLARAYYGDVYLDAWLDADPSRGPACAGARRPIPSRSGHA